MVTTLKRFDLATLPTSTGDRQTSAVASMQIRDFFLEVLFDAQLLLLSISASDRFYILCYTNCVDGS